MSREDHYSKVQRIIITWFNLGHLILFVLMPEAVSARGRGIYDNKIYVRFLVTLLRGVTSPPIILVYYTRHMKMMLTAVSISDTFDEAPRELKIFPIYLCLYLPIYIYRERDIHAAQ